MLGEQGLFYAFAVLASLNNRLEAGFLSVALHPSSCGFASALSRHYPEGGGAQNP
jgi:hypothetical protein